MKNKEKTTQNQPKANSQEVNVWKISTITLAISLIFLGINCNWPNITEIFIGFLIGVGSCVIPFLIYLFGFRGVTD